MKYKILAVVVFISVYLSDSHAGKSFTAPNNQYVLIERQFNHANKMDYAGFKFLKQGTNLEELIKYEWISLNNGDKTVQIESQNFEFGETTMVGKFGIGFEGYRFFWEPGSIDIGGKINCAFECEGIVKICLSGLPHLWGINIQKEMSKLENEEKCVQWK